MHPKYKFTYFGFSCIINTPTDWSNHMRINREWLGGEEVIDLGTPEGWQDFAHNVVQDEDVAIELADRIRDEGEVVVNESEPVFIERYTRLNDTKDVTA